jgi:hypothetical protein
LSLVKIKDNVLFFSRHKCWRCPNYSY